MTTEETIEELKQLSKLLESNVDVRFTPNQCIALISAIKYFIYEHDMSVGNVGYENLEL